MNISEYFYSITNKLLGENQFYEVTAQELYEGFKTSVDFSEWALILERYEIAFSNSGDNVQKHKHCAFSIVKDINYQDVSERKAHETHAEILADQVLACLHKDRTNVKALFGFDIAKVQGFFTELPNRQTAVGIRVEFTINHANTLKINKALWKSWE